MRDILGAIKQNSNIHYLYFSVPLFSLTVFLEMVFDNCFHRHLGGAHNHLFTLDSIDYMCQEFGFEQIASWQFGTDIMDMYRMVRCSLDMQGERVKEMFDKKFLECSESLQKIIDERDFCSEVHMLVKILH